jgi:hypothetical protein
MAEPSPELSSETSDVRLQRAGTMRAATWGLLGLFVALLLTLLLGTVFGLPRWLGTPLGWGLLLTPVLALVTAIAGELGLRAGKALSVEGTDIVVRRARGERRIPASTLVEGWLSPREKRVYLQTRRGDVYSAQVKDEALLERAGLDASKRTLRMRLGPVDFLTAMGWLVGPAIAIPIADVTSRALRLGGALGIPLALSLFVLQFYLIRQIFGPAHLVIGSDGIIVKQRWRRRFVSFDELRSISADRDHVTLHLQGGETLRARARNLDEAAQETIQARVNAALALRGARSAEPGALAQLDKGSRTGAAWRDALSGLLDKDRGYRAARLTREQILGVLENPAAPAGRRIGAALALAGTGDSEAATRIRIAAGAAANERVRVALEKIAGGEIEAEAIDEAAEDEARRAGS